MRTNLYLDKRGGKEKPEYPIKVAINVRGSSAYIATGVSVPVDCWDKGSGHIKDHPQRARLELKLSEKKLAVDKAIESLREDGRLRGAGAAQIKSLVEKFLAGAQDGDDGEVSVLECFDKCMATKDRARTLQSYRETKKRISLFCGASAPSLKFTDITPAWLMDFDSFLSKTNKSANARGVYMRTLRAVFNYALSDGLTEARYPFRRFKIRKDPTRDRSLTREEIYTLATAPVSPSQEKYRDIFLLSLYLCGINLADLLSLTAVHSGRVEFRRIKTGQPVTIGVQPEAELIIKRYRGKVHLLDIGESYTNYRYLLRRINDSLKRIGQVYNPHTKKWEGDALFPDISYYWARHTWGTLAAELDVPERTIGAALGHSTSKSVTSVYIRVDMRKKIDAANRKVIDYIFKKNF